MIVYRLEHSCGRGIYQDLSSSLEGVLSSSEDFFDLFCLENHPTPSNDGLGYLLFQEDDGWFFGFKSFGQTFAWFGKAQRDVLSRVGANLCAYEVDTNLVEFGGRQVVFKIHEAEFLGSVELISGEREQKLLNRLTKSLSSPSRFS